jgi:PIN domain nuclease of toxin-antitoxin system
MILDTCALLFLASGDRRLSADARAKLKSAPARWYCAISAFELALKLRDGKLTLPLPAPVWVTELAARYALTEVPLDTALCAAAAVLPPHHRDPCDRFIIAAALRLGVPVVTVDPRFEVYGVPVVS